MAISSGVGAHYAWATVNGATFALDKGTVSFAAMKKSSTFTAQIPLGLPGVEDVLGPNLGDNTTTISVSTRGQRATLITGEIDDVAFDYIKGTVSISGRDASAKLHTQKSAEKWVNKQPHQIISDIAGRVGLSAEIDALALKAGRLVQIDWAKLTDGVSYAAVIHKLCEFMGAHWWVQAGSLMVKSTASEGTPYVIHYSPGPPKASDALSLTVHRNVQAGKPIKVSVKSWDARKKQASVGQYSIGGNGTTVNYAYHLPGLTQDHVAQHAKAKAKDHVRHELELNAELVGDPTIDPSQALQLIGTAFAQTFTIDTLEHSFGMGGHAMMISAKSAAQGRL